MKILTTALYSFIIEVLWILNTVRYNWSLSYTHRNTHHHWAPLGTAITLTTPSVLSLNQVISYKPSARWIAAQLNGIIVSTLCSIGVCIGLNYLV